MKWYEYIDQRTKQKVWWTQRDTEGICWEIRHEPGSLVFRLYKCGLLVSEWGTLSQAMNDAEGRKIMKKMKKSLVDAMARARAHSLEHPDTTVWVMDKLGERSVITAISWVKGARIMEGWHTVVSFRNGEKE